MLRVLLLILFIQYYDLDCRKAKVFTACSFGIADAANWPMALVVVLPNLARLRREARKG
jgi:hypothetical protein